MRTAAKARIAGVVGFPTLIYGLFAFGYFFSSDYPAAAEAAKINSQLESQEMSVSELDSKIASYWTAITDASTAGKVTIPNSPQAYCQNLPVATSQLESGLNSLLCTSLETRAQTSEALPALQAQIQVANEKARRESGRLAAILSSGTFSFIVGVAGLIRWNYYSRQERKERYRQQNPASPA